MEKLLSEFKVGQRGKVKKVLGEGKLRRRMFDMGITPDTDIILKKKAPLGDPLEISLRGYELSLRKSEASQIVMG